MSPVDFEWQMQALQDWGYTTIPISLLVEAITKGSLLPPKPVVITFDDGYEDAFTNAFPIMQSMGDIGVLYIVGNYIGSAGYLSADQIKAMIANGWEIGSHSMSHPHLPADHDILTFEAGQSKSFLASISGVDVKTFAYPYGESDPVVFDRVSEYGYLAAVGLGGQYIQGLNNLYNLRRIEVRSGTDLNGFASLLPWASQP